MEKLPLHACFPTCCPVCSDLKTCKSLQATGTHSPVHFYTQWQENEINLVFLGILCYVSSRKQLHLTIPDKPTGTSPKFQTGRWIFMTTVWTLNPKEARPPHLCTSYFPTIKPTLWIRRFLKCHKIMNSQWQIMTRGENQMHIKITWYGCDASVAISHSTTP